MGRMLAPMLGGVESQLGSVQQGDGPLQLQSPIPGVALPQYQPDPTQPAIIGYEFCFLLEFLCGISY